MFCVNVARVGIPLICLTPPHLFCLSQARTWISNVEKIKYNILCGENNRGTSAIGMAFICGNCEVMNSYLETVLSSNIACHKKERLLFSGGNGIKIFFRAFVQGQTECVGVYARAIIESNLKLQTKEKLLVGYNKKLGSFLPLVMVLGKYECFELLKETIMNSDLKEKEKKILIRKM